MLFAMREKLAKIKQVLSSGSLQSRRKTNISQINIPTKVTPVKGEMVVVSKKSVVGGLT